MHKHPGRLEAAQRDSLFHPEHNVVTVAALVVSEVMIKTELFDLPCLKKRNRLCRPVDAHPTWRGHSFIVKIDAHGRILVAG